MAENTWTASTTTSWIWFDSNKRYKSVTGNSGSDIKIYIDEATEPTTDVNGKITITANGSSFDKTITRCAPSVTSTTNELTFDVYYNGSQVTESTFVDPCENGKRNDDTSGVEIRNIVLKTIEHYSTGGEGAQKTKSLTSSDVNIWYILPDNTRYGYLPVNNDKDRYISVKVELKSDTKINSTKIKAFGQNGIKNDDGEYDESELIPESIGYESETINYGELDIAGNCTDITTSCEGGEFDYQVTGFKTKEYGTKTGLTVCNVKVIIDNGSQGASTAYTSDDVTFAVAETQYARFDGNKLIYGANETKTTDRILHITATLVDDTTKTAATTFTVKKGNECGSPMYIIFKCDKDYIDYTGGTAIFKYYLSETENGNEGSAIKDQTINNCLSFSAPQGITVGSPTYSNGVFSVNATFMQNTYKNGEEGYTWIFSASCESAEEDTKTISLYQANKREQIIPNCDYFIFKYIWGDEDGRDLDSLTHISNCPTFSGKTVGWQGTAGDGDDKEEGFRQSGRTKVVSGDTGIYLKFGGDNQCNGSEYTIICLKNILDAWKNNKISFVSAPNNDIMYIDIYANWYGSKGTKHEMQIEYSQYSGITAGGYDEEITETKYINTCLADPTYYYSFEPTPNKCISVSENVKSSAISVNAAGKINASLASKVSCIDGPYSHVLRLNYNFTSKTPSIQYFTDNGFDVNSDTKIVRINGVDNKLTYNYTASTGSEVHVKYENVYIKHTVNGITHDVSIFGNEEDHINCNEWKPSGQSYEYTYSNFIEGKTVDFNFVKNFKITPGNPVTSAGITIKTINIEFDMTQASEDREFDLGIHCLTEYLGTCGSLVYSFGFIQTHQKVS